MNLCCAIITCNSPDDLDETIRSVYAMNCPVFVGDDSDETYTESVRAVCKRWNAHYVPGPKLGPVGNRFSVAQNVLSSGEYSHVLLLDDDITLSESNFLSMRMEAQENLKDIICVAIQDGSGGPIVHPTEVNWKGVRCIPAPPTGGTGLSDNCMLWPAIAIDQIDWDVKIKYGYAEAWLGAQAHASGVNIRVLQGIAVLHRWPGRGRVQPNDLETARVYYNFLIKGLIGNWHATTLFVLDIFLTSGKRLLYGKRLQIRAYIDAIRLLRERPGTTSV